MKQTTSPKRILVTGANGFIGFWLVAALLNRGHYVTAAMRHAKQRKEDYVADIMGRLEESIDIKNKLEVVEFDLEKVVELESEFPSGGRDIQVVYHLAAAFSWGLENKTAHQQNVDGSLNLLDWLSGLDKLERFLWVGGYRVASAGKLSERELYQSLGAYEASKLIAHKNIIAKADQLNIPWTALNPSTVIGDSTTGDTRQFVGVAEIVEQMFNGELAAIPGNERTFVPLTNVDFVAEFAARVFEFDESIGQQYWLLDENTPTLPKLINGFANHMGLKAPKYSVPVSVLKRVPEKLMPGSKETLSFLSDDSYDVTSTQQLSAKMGICQRAPVRNIEGWIDSLVNQGFGHLTQGESLDTPNFRISGGYHKGVYVRNYRRADSNSRNDIEDQSSSNVSLVCLHGLPLEGLSWHEMISRLNTSTIVPDLPGLGRSGGKLTQNYDWLDSLIDEPAVLVGHSLGTGLALQYAHSAPDKVKGLVLISPYFLQGKPGLMLRSAWLMKLVSKFIDYDKITSGLHPQGVKHTAVANSQYALTRPSVRSNIFQNLALAGKQKHREHMSQLLQQLDIPVLLIAGEKDPLLAETNKRVVEIAGAGHNPQLTHPSQVAQAIKETIS